VFLPHQAFIGGAADDRNTLPAIELLRFKHGFQIERFLMGRPKIGTGTLVLPILAQQIRERPTRRMLHASQRLMNGAISRRTARQFEDRKIAGLIERVYVGFRLILPLVKDRHKPHVLEQNAEETGSDQFLQFLLALSESSEFLIGDGFELVDFCIV
jgi:hypothetical protein